MKRPKEFNKKMCSVLCFSLCSVLTMSLFGCGSPSQETSNTAIVLEYEEEMSDFKEPEKVSSVVVVDAPTVEKVLQEQPKKESAITTKPKTTVSDNTPEEVKEEPVTEVEEEIVELTEVEKLAQEFNLTLYKEEDILVRYTNTSSNIRKTPDKDGEKLTSLPINTEISVLGITTPENKADEWSLIQLSIENTDTYCFIKSSLLSDTKIKITTPPKTTQPSQSNKGATPQTTTPSTPSNSENSGGSTSEIDQKLLDAFGGSIERNRDTSDIIF